ncbi:MAG: hypothetical protein WBF34_04480 [Streptosporangiaceae bacterium]|jgi:hypothetical protein
MRADVERHDLHGDRRAARGGPRQSAQLPAHHRCTSHLLLERRLADDQVNLRLALFEDRPLPGEDRLHRAVARGIILQRRIGLGQRPSVGRGLQ